MPKPLDPTIREQIEQAIRAGGHRNAIAREYGVAGSTVGKIARNIEPDLGHPAFDRAQTKRATAALQADQAAERARLRDLLLGDAHRLRAQLWNPAVFHSFGGKDHTHIALELDQPTFEQQKAIMTSVGICVDKIVRLDSTDAGVEQAAGLIERLMSGIKG